ncbi:Aspartic peptidase [Parasponia andersonii]|uniref:Aspartic peptidase n=1 Tax=Parasponia andersonii TaxID=3476 RepID=A0A2P5DWT5_PARAD|nr:Aspartic peptidase [Parasponia andersonii]
MVDMDIRPLLFMVFFSIFLLCLNFSSNGVLCFPEKKVLSLRDFQWKQPNCAPSCISQNSRRLNGATILEMKHRDYCSDKIIDWNKQLKKRLILDDLHVRSLQSHFKNRVSSSVLDESRTQIPLVSGIRLQILNYIVTVELGGKNMTVIVDTGSDLTWVQCLPCKLCYNQKEPLFNPSLSNSYQSVWCNSTTCQALQFATGNSGVCGNSNPPGCNYVVGYGDGSYTRGDLGRERLRLGTTPLNDFVFGCGRNNKGLFGGASGLMGLGRSDLSLISQSSSLFGGVFSYCLPSTEPGASGSLVMGFDSSAYENSTPISFTKMVPNPQLPTFYFVNLTGISIGGVSLRSSNFAQGGIVIDSGTVITRLAPSVYKAVKEEFVKQFSGFPSAPGFSILDTCFNLTGYDEVNIPTMKLHFEGNSELNIDATGILYIVKTDASQICLALASLSYEEEIGIIGNYQQKNQRVVYDTKGSKLGFAGEICSFI